MRAREGKVDRDEADDDGGDSHRQAASRARRGGLGQRRERDQRRRRGQAGTDQVGETEAVGQRLGYLRAGADQVARALGRQRDQDREPEPAADLA